MFLRSTIFTLTLFTTLVVSLAVSCKEKPQKVDNCSQHPESCNSVLIAKEFFLFKPGSWWVYEEEYSGVRDSMYVLNYANGSDYTFLMEIKSAFDGFEYRYWPEYNGQPNDQMCSQTDPVIKKCMNIKRSKGIPGAPGIHLGEGRCMFFQYNLYDSIPSINYPNYVNNFVKIVEIKNEFQLGNYLFDKTTVKVFNPHDIHDSDHPTYNYYTRGIGLIRKELIDTPEIWNLVNYHIEP